MGLTNKESLCNLINLIQLFAHIMIRIPKDANDSVLNAGEKKIKEAYAALKNGMPWDTAVTKYSEDKGSIKRGGELPWFGTGRMVPEFEIKDKIIVRGPKGFEVFIKAFNDKFKEYLGKDLSFEEKKFEAKSEKKGESGEDEKSEKPASSEDNKN